MQEFLGPLGFGMIEYLIRRAFLHDFPLVQKEHFARHLIYEAHFMRNENHRLAGGCGLFDRLKHLANQLRVKR